MKVVSLELTAQGLRKRQGRLAIALRSRGLAGALLVDPRHVFYFTGYRCRNSFAPIAHLDADGVCRLAVPAATTHTIAVDEIIEYAASRYATLEDDQMRCSLAALAERTAFDRPMGCDATALRINERYQPFVDLLPEILPLRRHKSLDEITLIRRAIAGAEAAYEYAKAALSEKLTEVELVAGMQAAAIREVGEQIGEFGNDFQIGELGGFWPRRRFPKNGEIATLDVSVEAARYHCDLCRSFVVGRRPSDDQQRALDRILEVHAVIRRRIEPGVSCRSLFAEADKLLEGYSGWTFGHHLGHGVGLNPHEAPRLNPHWDDQLEIGDVIAVEPGLYHPSLRVGVRIEEMYWLAEDGLRQLSSFPAALA